MEERGIIVYALLKEVFVISMWIYVVFVLGNSGWWTILFMMLMPSIESKKEDKELEE